MSVLHTPGKFEAIGNLVRSPMIQEGNDGRPCGVKIAESFDGYGLPHGEEAIANAKLFAAAPDLLAALEMVDSLCYPVVETCRDAIREAIAKAKGTA